MKRDEALTILAAHREELAAFGLRRLAVFGSVARDEAGPDSDVDVLVEFEGEPTFKRYATLYDRLEEMLPCPVDLVTADAARPSMREGVEEDANEVQDYRSSLDVRDEYDSKEEGATHTWNDTSKKSKSRIWTHH